MDNGQSCILYSIIGKGAVNSKARYKLLARHKW